MILTIEELAERWKMSRSRLYVLCQQKKIPCFKVGGQWRFNMTVIEQYERGEIEGGQAQ